MSDNLEINIEEIIQKIREEIQEKGYKETDLSFQDIPIPEISLSPSAQALSVSPDDLGKVLDYLSANYEHDILMPVSASNPLSGLVKKAVRKVVRFLFYPVLAQQNAVNGGVIGVLNILAERYEGEQKAEQTIRELQERVEKLEAELRGLRISASENEGTGEA